MKSTSDLFLVQSNLYGVRHGSLVMSAERPDGSTPLIKLGREFTSVEDYLRRIPHGVPTITQLDHLTVAGDVMFGENVTLKVRTYYVCCATAVKGCISRGVFFFFEVVLKRMKAFIVSF